MELDYKKMVEDIAALVETDFMFEMDCKNLPNSEPITTEEAMEMVKVLGNVYTISHSITCEACQGKYVITPTGETN